MKTALLGLKSDITTLTDLTHNILNKICLSTERIESEKCLGVTQLKNELKVMRMNIRDTKDSVDTLQLQASASGTGKSRRRKSGGKTRGGKHAVDTTGLSTRLSFSVSGGVDDEPVDVQEVLNHTISDDNENDREMGGNNVDLSQTEDQQGQVDNCQRSENSVDVRNANTTSCWPSGETSVELVSGTFDVSSSDRVGTTSQCNNPALYVNPDRSVESSEVNIEYREPCDERTYRHVAVTSSARINQPQNFSRFRYTESRRDTYQENSGGALSGRPIDTRVTRPNERVSTKNELSENSITDYIEVSRRDRDVDDDSDVDDFQQYVKKTAKRFYLGVVLPSVTRQVIAKYIRKRARGSL